MNQQHFILANGNCNFLWVFLKGKREKRKLETLLVCLAKTPEIVKWNTFLLPVLMILNHFLCQHEFLSIPCVAVPCIDG